jgi:hypothetical protein
MQQLMQKGNFNVGFQENREYFCRKFVKVAKNSDHNIGLGIIIYSSSP